MQIKSLTWKLANWRHVRACKPEATLQKAWGEWGLAQELCMDCRAGQTMGFLLLSLQLTAYFKFIQLPKQSILLLKANGFLQGCLPKYWKSLQSCTLHAFSLADNTQCPLLPRYHLLSFPLHRLPSSPLLPLTTSTRSNFPDLNSCLINVPRKLCCQGSERNPSQAACFLYQATGFADLPLPMVSGRHL